jgi:hypothetical protein
MTSWAEELLAMAKTLPRADQLRLAAKLQADSVADADPVEIQAAWADEIADRLEVVERGEAELVDADTVFARIRAKY